jgi:hypothetical protein
LAAHIRDVAQNAHDRRRDPLAVVRTPRAGRSGQRDGERSLDSTVGARSIELANAMAAVRLARAPALACPACASWALPRNCCTRPVLDGVPWALGDLRGQQNRAFLSAGDQAQLTADPDAFACTGTEVRPIAERLAWKRTRPPAPVPVWPPRGVHLCCDFAPLPAKPVVAVIRARWHLELYDALQLGSAWVAVENAGAAGVELDSITTLELAMFEGESRVDPARTSWRLPPVHVETDFAFGGMTAGDANGEVVHLVADPLYLTQVHYERQTPCLLQVRPAVGPAHARAGADVRASGPGSCCSIRATASARTWP